MTTTAFDTLKAKEALLAVGIEDSHASSIVGITRLEAVVNRNMVTVIAVGGVIIAALKLPPTRGSTAAPADSPGLIFPSAGTASASSYGLASRLPALVATRRLGVKPSGFGYRYCGFGRNSP